MNKYIFLLLMSYIAASAQEAGARYLIITHDNFYNAIQPLAQWKHRKGMRTKVVKLSEIGSSTNQIKDYVEDAYDTWQTPPEFLLLVGAPNYLPFYYYGGGWNSYYSDNYYTNMDYDVYNEILSGRLTVHSSTEAQTVVNKILQYEMAPDISDSRWFINACLIVREDYDWHDDSIYWSDINHAKNLMRNHGYDTIDTLSRTGGDNANDVIQSANSGRAFVLYRGSGVNNWYSPFNVNPDQTQNSTKLPIVLSITCRTIGTSSSPATAERWLLTGGPSLPRGAAGYFATTTTIMGGSHLRSAVCKGFFNALFQEGKRRFGEACEGGRVNVYENYNSSSEYRGFTTLGDPEMNIWTAIPKPLDVFHDSLLSIDDDSLVVRVEFQGVPQESALVCIVHDTLVYEYGYTASNGEIDFNFESLGSGYMHVTVTAHNKIPYLDSIHVVSTHVEEMKELKTTNVYNITVHPNPFTHSTKIRYSILDTRYLIEDPTIIIYDATGRLVKSFSIQTSNLLSSTSVVWDGTDQANRKLGSGVYFLRFSFAREERSIPIVLLQ
jgi:hypothetical protein